MKRFNLQQIQDYWNSQAQSHKQSHAASWSDKPVIEMEIREILKHLEDGDTVLDAGCSNGYSTIQFAAQRDITITGLDYLASMIEYARQSLDHLKDSLRGTVTFDVGDATHLPLQNGTFDKVVVKRVICNLGEYKHQLAGIGECTRVLKPGGLLLLSDAVLQCWERLNAFRGEWQLPDIPMPSFNNYLDRDRVIEDATTQLNLELVETSNFSSTYYVGTRLIKPLLIQALGLDINVADPGMEWNRWFSQLPAWGDYGTQELFVFKKK